MRVKRFFLALALLCLLPLTAGALDVPPLRGHVNDLASMLSAEMELKIERFLTDFEASDSTQIALLTVASLQGEPLEVYALKVAEAWGIGQKGKDNGALLLVSRDDRKIRIEVGYGLEGRLTDLLSGRIIDQEISPRFRQGDFDGGIAAGIIAMAEAVRGEYKGSGSSRQKEERNPLGLLALLLFLGPGLLFLTGGRSHRGSRRGGLWIGGPPFRGGGGFGGGGFGGGGGGFGGGGASGGW
ncbi:TPM domain-containing protein [Desulfuromonas sp. AOP6]|uniref:TPM domain-containing protein n=1 Tax=Desulfuromonas sp. AOP6 TaxID=1566351 RepID=UPI00127DDD8D|nr:TPM domain-containing protein [Desulfuromonas sp. AOP6]BCA80578.1 hypothetical protein AOP6_2365 [Desulfuromonas sp. AOP6]